jgi:GNAT superfamily N-acetyltransferase
VNQSIQRMAYSPRRFQSFTHTGGFHEDAPHWTKVQYKKALSDEELKAATEVDFENEIALMVTIGEKETETIIGAGRYVAFDAAGAQRSAEVAFTVEEDYQGLGIASITLRHLAGIAKGKGIAQFDAEVLQENRGMLTVFKRSGFPMKQKYAEGVVHVTLSLGGERSNE